MVRNWLPSCLEKALGRFLGPRATLTRGLFQVGSKLKDSRSHVQCMRHQPLCYAYAGEESGGKLDDGSNICIIVRYDRASFAFRCDATA